MINEQNKGTISFQEDIKKSEYFNNLVASEFREISTKDKFLKDAISLRQQYVYHNDEIIEFGLFLINNTSSNMYLEELPFFLNGPKGKIKVLNYEIKKNIEKNKAAFIEIIINNDLEINEEDYALLTLTLGDISDISIENNIEINSKEISRGESYASLKDLRSFIKKLPKIKGEKLHINCYKIDYIEDSMQIVLVIRNSSSEEVNIKSLPVGVFDNNNLLLYRKIFTFEKGELAIRKRGIKIAVITIPKEDIVITTNEFANYKVSFN